MGMKLVGMALTKWAPHVPDRAFRLLVRMASTALDEPSGDMPAALYFGGRDLLMSTLRAERNGSLKSLERSVERGIKDLIRVGAIERTNRAYFGERAVYRLTLFNPIRIDEPLVDNREEPDTEGRAMPDTHGGAMPDTQGGKSPTPTGGPMSTEEVLEEQLEEEGVDLSGPVTVRAREPTSEPQPELAPPKCDQPGCAKGYVLVGDPPTIAKCPTCHPNSNVIQFPRRETTSAQG